MRLTESNNALIEKDKQLKLLQDELNDARKKLTEYIFLIVVISYYLLLKVFAELNREKFISIAACIYNNIGIDDDMALICLNDKDATEKMLKNRK